MTKLNVITKLCLAVSLLFFFSEIQHIHAQTDIPGGDVSGTWTLVQSPYQINGEITIPDGETLTIEPGVDVIFTGHYKFNVQGRLLAVGTETDTIVFTIIDTTGFSDLWSSYGGWHGIRFDNTPATNDSSRIVYCKLQYGKANTGNDSDHSGGAIFMLNFSKAVISNCLIDHNISIGFTLTGGGGIFLSHSSPKILNNIISNNHAAGGTLTGGGGIFLYRSSPKILNNIISNNHAASAGGGIFIAANIEPVIGGNAGDCEPVIDGNIVTSNSGKWGAGIYVCHNSDPLVINNVIIHNKCSREGGGIACEYSGTFFIINNTIAYNSANYGGGIDFDNESDAVVINTIIYGNSANIGNQVSVSTADADPSFLYCDIEGGKDQFGGDGTGDNYTGMFENNIDSDPLFTDAANGDYYLSDASLCIGAGADSVEINGTWHYAPSADIEGNLRPNPGGSSPDIGAFESKLGNPLTRIVEDEITSSSLEGNPMGDPATRKMMIYLPPSYDQGGNFPVVYLLHGTPVGETAYLIEENWLDWVGVIFSAGPDFPENGFDGMLDDLIAEGKMKEMIIVMPDASCKYMLSFYTNSELNGNYEDYIVNDLVSYIDSHYRTIPNRDSRAIVGHCQGGYGSLKLAMKHPDVFGVVASHSAPLMLEVFKASVPMVIAENPDGMIGPHPERPFTSMLYAMCAAWSPNLSNPPFFVDLLFEYPSGTIIDSVWNKWLEHDPFTMLTTYGANLASLRGVYFDCGDQDEFQFNLLIDPFHQALAAAGIGHEYEIFAGGTHCNKLYSRLALSLSFISDALVTGVEQKDKAEVPLAFSLSQNYPNPFNPTTSISFVLPKMAYVTLEIYNLLGQSVRTLGEDVKEAGSHSVLWDGRDATGRDVASGLYLYCLEVEGQYVQIRKMVLLR